MAQWLRTASANRSARHESAQDVIAKRDTFLAVADRVVHRQPDRPQLGPSFSVRQIVGNRADKVEPHLVPAMSMVVRFMASNIDSREVVLQMISEEPDKLLVVDQRIEHRSSSWIGQFNEMVLDTGRGLLGHGSHPNLPRVASRKRSGSCHESPCPIYANLPSVAQSP